MPDKTLSQRDLEEIYALVPEKDWPASRLKLIYAKCIPADATLDDLLLFLHFCHSRNLDPLVSEAYLRLQWDKLSGSKKPVVIFGIGGMLRNAQSSGQMDGMRVEFSEANGQLISATCLIHKKGCEHHFEATVFLDEYAQTNKDGKVVGNWASMPHVMLSKVATAACLRIAFPVELTGCYEPSEFQRPEPSSDFLVESRSGAQTSDVRRKVTLDKKEEKTAGDTAPSPSIQEHNTRETSTEPQPNQTATLRQRLLAEKERLLTDLDIPRDQRKGALDKYFRGFLSLGDSETMPKPPEDYMSSLQMLDQLALNNRDATRERLLYNPRDLGVSARGLHRLWVTDQGFGWHEETCLMAMKLAFRFDLESTNDLAEYMAANDVAPANEPDVVAFLRLALFDRELAAEAASEAAQRQIGIAFVLDEIEQQLEARLETSTVSAAKGALHAKTESTAS